MFLTLYLLIMFASWAMMVREGLWSNSIALLNIVVSGLVAFGFYAPITVWLDEYFNGQFTYVLDFTLLWVLFVVTMLVLKTLMNFASKTRMRFRHPIDPVGGPLVGLIAAWVLAMFAMATLHTAPFPKEMFGGKLVHSSSDVQSASALMAPDLGWLRLVEKVSEANGFGAPGLNHFKADAFVKIYADHRDKFDKAPGLKVKR